MRYMPSMLGRGMMSINQLDGTFSPWICTLILTLYTASLVVIGTVLFVEKDA
jgi:hypothetical protein